MQRIKSTHQIYDYYTSERYSVGRVGPAAHGIGGIGQL